MSDRVSALRARPGRTGGFTLVDVVIALSVIAIGILGVVSLLLALKARNESLSTSRHAVLACQEMLEVVLTDKLVLPHDQWVSTWNKFDFQPRKLFVLDKLKRDSIGAAAKNDFSTYGGKIRITDVSDPELPDSMDEIAVSVDTTGLTPTPVKFSLVTRRSRR